MCASILDIVWRAMGTIVLFVNITYCFANSMRVFRYMQLSIISAIICRQKSDLGMQFPLVLLWIDYQSSLIELVAQFSIKDI